MMLDATRRRTLYRALLAIALAAVAVPLAMTSFLAQTLPRVGARLGFPPQALTLLLEALFIVMWGVLGIAPANWARPPWPLRLAATLTATVLATVAALVIGGRLDAVPVAASGAAVLALGGCVAYALFSVVRSVIREYIAQ